MTARAIRVALAALSFVVYAAAALSLDQARSIPFPIEELESITSAISRRLYGSPLGMADRGVVEYFIRNSDLPAERAVDGAMQGKVVQQYETYVVYRGNGVGATIDAELAFAI